MIKRLRISDFKSIRKLDLELDPVTVLVGRSGTGKSNLVQAIRFLRNLLLNQEQAVHHENGWQRICPVGEKVPKTSIEVVFSVPGESRDYSYQLKYATRAPGHVSSVTLIAERLTLAGEVLYSRSRDVPHLQWRWEKSPNLAALPNHLEGSMLGSFPSAQKIVFAYAALSTGIGFYHFPSTTLGTGDIPRNAPLSSLPGLSDDASNYLEIMCRIAQDFDRPDIRRTLLASMQVVNPAIVSIELDSLTKPQRAIIGHEAAGRIFELSLEQESDGMRRFYAHLLALYQTPRKLTLVFEEPENAIFPGALSLLADEFKAAPHENRGQVIVTTHNPVLLDSFDVDNLRAVEIKDGGTVVGRVAKEQRDAVKERLLTTGELLTVETPRLDDDRVEQPV